MLQGRRILVLQSEFLIAFDLQVLLENEGAVVSVGPRCHPGENFDCLVVDSAASNQPLASCLAASGVPLVGYTGDTEAVSREYPDAVVIKKPALPAELLAAVRGAIRSEPVHGLCA